MKVHEPKKRMHDKSHPLNYSLYHSVLNFCFVCPLLSYFMFLFPSFLSPITPVSSVFRIKFCINPFITCFLPRQTNLSLYHCGASNNEAVHYEIFWNFLLLLFSFNTSLRTNFPNTLHSFSFVTQSERIAALTGNNCSGLSHFPTLLYV